MVAFLAVLMIIPFRGRKRRLIVVTNIVSSNRTWTTTLSLEKSSRNMLILNRLHCMNLLRFIATHLKMSLAVVVSTVIIRVTSSQILRSRVPEDVETD